MWGISGSPRYRLHMLGHISQILWATCPLYVYLLSGLQFCVFILEPHKYAAPQVTPFLRSRLSPELTSPRLQERGGPLLLASGSETWLALWNDCEWEGARSRGSPWLLRAKFIGSSPLPSPLCVSRQSVPGSFFRPCRLPHPIPKLTGIHLSPLDSAGFHPLGILWSREPVIWGQRGII